MKRARLLTLIITIILLTPSALIQRPALAAVDVNANIQTIYAFITQDMGLTRAAACGILSNIRSESNFNPEAIGDSGNAYGICQWNSRRQAMINYCLNNGYDSWTDLMGQLNYMRYELENNKKSVGDYLKTIPDTPQGAFDAAHYFCVYYEIPSDRYNKGVTRGKRAVNTYWIDFGGTVNTYEVTYDANGGVNAPAAQQKTEGVPLTLTDTAPRRQGYELAGWAQSPTAKTPEYLPGASYTPNSAIKLYAVWQKALADDTQPLNTLTLGAHTYEYYAGEFSWAYADEFAAKRGGTLASVRSAAEAQLINTLLSDAAGACFLGGTLADGNWIWSTGEAFDDAFAQNYWAAGEPALEYGVSDLNRLLRARDGKWAAVSGLSGEAAGFIVEYGANDHMDFETYRINVSSTLNLRAGPSTSYPVLGVMIPGTLITIYESVPVSGGKWGWGVTKDGARGWCSMKSDYMAKVSGVDAATQLVYQEEASGEITIINYEGGLTSLEIPRTLAGLNVTGISAGAFTKCANLMNLSIGDWVKRISPDAFHGGMVITGGAGTAAHRAAVAAGVSFEMILPGDRWILPEGATEIGEEAFAGVNARCVDISVTGITRIAENAFNNCANLTTVLLPATLEYIAPNAFPRNSQLTFIVVPGSYAESWANDNGFECVPYSGE